MAALTFAEFYLSDGSEFINLLTPRNQSGFTIQDWQPLAPEPKDGGIFQGSPLSSGRRLVLRNYDNTIEGLTLAGRGNSPDGLIFESQRIRRLLEKAVNYWTTEWQSEPVYIIARGVCETNVRYGLIYDYRAPGDGNPFASPFTGPDAAIFNEWALSLEHDAWAEVAPGQSVCVELSGTQVVDTQKSFHPDTALDDVYVTVHNTTLSNNNLLLMGDLFGQGVHTGIRFRAVDIPPDATIVQAFVRLQSTATITADNASFAIYGESDVTPSIFSTYADFIARPLTSSYINWSADDWIIGGSITSPDLSNVIQEIIGLPGWASGNDLVLFVRNAGSTTNVTRQGASFSNPTYAAPELVIVYDAPDILGREATCLPEVYIANKQNTANITHLFILDASAGTFSSNLFGAALPYQLFPFPAGVGVGDILYAISDTSIANSGPFSSLVWDIGIASASITFVYEYWTGLAWAAVVVQDNTNQFQNTGVNSMHWIQPSPWGTTTVNGITGYIIRFRVTVAGGALVVPTQQNRQPYSITWANVNISSGQVGGDLPALARHKIFTQSALENTPAGLGNMRTIIGLRSVSRGFDFTSIINFSDEQMPDNVIANTLVPATFVTDTRAPSGRAVQYVDTGIAALAPKAYIRFAGVTEFYGRYRAFLRLTVDTGTADAISLQLFYGTSSSIAIQAISPLVTLSFIDEWLLVDMGQIVIPFTNTLKTTDTYEFFFITVEIAHTDDTDLTLYDLCLMPIDEWSGDFVDPVKSVVTQIDALDYLDVDSVTFPRVNQPVRAIHREISGNEVISIWQPITSQPAILQANATQQIHILSAVLDSNSSMQQSFPYVAHKIQTERVQRYLSMRGNR